MYKELDTLPVPTSLRIEKVPKIFEQSGYVFHFYSANLNEPIHVHVDKDGKQAKFWVNPIKLEQRGRFTDHELNEIE